jgi:hypothetical protein
MPKSPIPAAGGAMSATRPPSSALKKRASPPSLATSEAQAPRLKGVKVGEAKRDATTTTLKANRKGRLRPGPGFRRRRIRARRNGARRPRQAHDRGFDPAL